MEERASEHRSLSCEELTCHCLHRQTHSYKTMADDSASPAVSADADVAVLAARAARQATALGHAYFDHRRAADGTPSPLLTIVRLLREGDQWEKEEVAAAVGSFSAVDSQVKDDLVAFGTIEALVELLKNAENDAQKEHAIEALRTIGEQNAAATEALVKYHAIEALVEIVRVGPEKFQEKVIGALLLMPQDLPAIKTVLVDLGIIPALVALLHVESAILRERSYGLLTVLARGSSGFGTMIVEAGVLIPLVETLKNGTGGLKEAAAGIIAFLDTDVDKDAAVAAGALEPLVMMLREGPSDDKFWAAFALGTLAANTTGEKRPVLVDVFAVRSVIQFVRDGNNKQLMAGVLACLAYCCPVNCDILVEAGAVGPLVHLLRSGTNGEQRMAAMALGNLAFRHPANQDIVLSAGVIPPMMEMLRSGDDEQKRTAADALGDIVSGNKAAQFTVIQAGAVPLLTALAKDGSEPQKIKAVRALGKLAGGNKYVQTTVGQSGAVEVITDQLWASSAASSEWRLLATRALGKLAANHTGNQSRVVNARVVGMFVANWRTADEKEKRTIAKTLGYVAENEVAHSMVEALGGLDIIKAVEPIATH